MTTPYPHNHRAARHVKYALIVLGVVLTILVILLFREYRSLRRAQVINAREAWSTAFIRQHRPPTANDAGFIRPWMTFDYINKIFNLPSDYLKTQLQITDPRYPKLSISGYARSQHIDTGTFLGSVMSAVRNYLTTK